MNPITLRYGKRKIPIYYESYNSVHRIKGNRGIRVVGDSSGEERNFKEIEESAQIYLIHRAAQKERKGLHLVEIDKVKQTIVGDVVNNHLEFEIILEGIAVFR